MVPWWQCQFQRYGQSTNQKSLQRVELTDLWRTNVESLGNHLRATTEAPGLQPHVLWQLPRVNTREATLSPWPT